MQKTLTELKQLYPFIYLTPSETPWYTGSSLDKYSTYDHEHVSPWYNTYKEIDAIQRVDESFECMGKEHILKMPKLVSEDPGVLEGKETSTTELFNTIVNLAKYKAISNDKIYVLWKHILASYEVYTHSYTSSGAAIIYFVKNKTKRETDTFTPTDSFFTLLQAKEMLDGKIRFRPYAVGGQLSKITQDDINHDLNVYGNYTQTLRNIAHSESGFYKKTGLLLQGWQYKAKLSLARETVRVAARRMGKCVDINEKILTVGGYKKAGDIKPGDMLHGTHGPVTVLNTEYNTKRCVKVVLENGMSKKVTYDHHCPTQINFKNNERDLNISKYKEAGELTSKDFIPCIYNIENNSTQGTFSEGLVVGYILGDGSTTGNNINVHVHNKESQNHLVSHLPESLYKIHEKFIYINKDLSKKLIDTYDIKHKAINKFIPDNTRSSSNDFKRGVVNGLLATDGYLGVSKGGLGKDGHTRRGYAQIEYCSVSEQLVTDLQLLLMELGVYTTKVSKPIKSNFKSDNTIAWYLRITEKESLEKINSNINLSFKKNYGRRLEIISIESNSKSTKNLLPKESFQDKKVKGIGHNTTYGGIRKPNTDYQRWKANNYQNTEWLNYSWNKVVSVEDIGEQAIISIETDGNHIYTVNGIYTHNTFAAVDEVRDFAFSEKRNDTKPTRCIFVGVNSKKNRSAKDYLRAQLKHLIDQGLVSEVASENRFYIYEQTGTASSTKTKKGLKTKAYIDFVGAKDDDPGVGDYADFIVIDEAEKIPEDVFDDFYALVTNERARILMISTLNPRSEKTWFYNKLIEGEKEEMERIARGETVEFLVRQIYEKYNLNQYKSIEDFYARCTNYDDIVEEWKSIRSISATRFTGWENSRLSESQVKEAALKQKSNNYIKYLAEFECVFPDESGVFELGGSNLDKGELQSKKFPYLVFAYDPADNGEDNRPLHVYAFDEETSSKTYGQIILLDENKNLKGVIEKHIPDVMLWIQDMCQKWLDKPWLTNYFFVYDSKGIATLAHSVMQKSGIKISLRFQTFYGYNVDIEAGNDVGIITHNVGKQGLIEGLVQKLFENNRIRISSACTGTYKELEMYSAYSEGKYVRYSAPKGKQDGNVSCLLSAVYFISEVLGKNTKIIKEQANRLKEQLAEMQQHHNMKLTDKEIHERTTARAKYELKKLEYSKRKKRLHFFGY